MRPDTFQNKYNDRSDYHGAALVITLAAVVLLSTMLVAFLSQASMGRRISFSSAGQYRADVLAKAGLETILGDLRTEMAAGSTLYTSNNVPIYIPNTNFTAVPTRIADNGISNILKKSAGSSNFWSGAYYSTTYSIPARAAANNNTATASLNGHRISPTKWNATYLLGTSVPAAFTPPDWVIVTRQGPTTNAA